MTGDYGTFKIDYTTPIDIAYLSTRLRSQDINEIAKDSTPYKSLEYGMKYGSCYTVLHDNLPVCAFGCVDMDGLSTLWMLSTNDIAKIKRGVIKHGKHLAQKLIGENEYGTNYVWVGNKQPIRWLKFIGAKFGDLVMIDDKEFIQFKIYK